MRMSSHVSVVLLLLVSGTAAASTCPSSDVRFLDTAPPFAVESATFDSTLYEGTWPVARGAFDVAAGRLAVLHDALFPGPTWVASRDAFDVAGVPAGTPVTLTVELVVDGEVTTSPFGCGGAGCRAGLEAWILVDGVRTAEEGGAALFAANARQDVHLARRATFSVTAGSPVIVEFGLLAARASGGTLSAEGAAAWRFVDVPEGVSVTSCRGFVSGPTPVAATSWGRLKSSYR